MKRILFVISIIALSACSSTPNAKECPPEKNYIKSNPTAMDKYKEEFKQGKIEGLYHDIYMPVFNNEIRNPCKSSSCITFNYKVFKFSEYRFNDSLRNGVYTSYVSKDRNDPKCKDTPASVGVPVCFYLIKNENNEIKSKYGMYMRSLNQANTKKFYKIDDNVVLYESSSTIYLTGAIGGPGYGLCGVKNVNVNNLDYKFNPSGFPSNPLKIIK